jgi:hypothetical protein
MVVPLTPDVAGPLLQPIVVYWIAGAAYHQTG